MDHTLAAPPLLAVLALTDQLGAVPGADIGDQVAIAILGWTDGVFTELTMRQVVRPPVISTLREGPSV